MKDIMIDIETLGQREDAIILSIACIPFEWDIYYDINHYIDSGIKINLNIQEQEQQKRTTDKVTIDWWKKQDKNAIKCNITQPTNVQSVLIGLTQLTVFIKNSDYDFQNSYVWSRGNYFDFPKIEHIYRISNNLPLPFNYWKIRDTRTFIDINNVDSQRKGLYDLKEPLPNNFIHHDCLHDCALEVARIVELTHILLGKYQ